MSFKVTILGSSGAMPAYGRHTSAQLVEIQNRYFLVDCGESVQIQLARFQANVHRIDHILISHLHGDHYLGLMGLLFTMQMQRRTEDLHLYSYKGLDEIITAHLRYSQSTLAYRVIFHSLQPDAREIIFEDNALTVETIPLLHKIKCSGFLFREKPKPKRIDKTRMPEGLLLQQIASLKRGEDVYDNDGMVLYKNEEYTLTARRSRSYAYCSDTAYYEHIVEQIQHVNLLYHESTFIQEDESKAKETKHSTAIQAATIAKLANVDKLLLGHFSARYKDLTPILDEAKTIFPNAQLALEGEEITIQE